MMTSLSGEWRTPRQLFAMLDREFGFQVDLACTPENQLCANGLSVNSLGIWWTEFPSPQWCNPPYGREIGDWIEKAHRESRSVGGPTIVMLLPARTDTQWFHDHVLGKAEIRFLKGRLYFNDTPNGRAPFPSMVVVFRGRE